MSDQPTNHRAQAEHWLELADGNWETGTDHPTSPTPADIAAAVAALIGIGHALLAGIDELAEDEPSYTACRYVERPGGVILRCDRAASHGGTHRMRLDT